MRSPLFLLAATACALALPAHAQSTPSGSAVAYPAHDQTPKQQQKDRFDCYEWAKGQSGFDPTLTSGVITAAVPTSANGNGLSTTGAALGGAVGGAAIGELSGHDAGRGAAIGALGGAAAQRLKAQQAAQQRQQQLGQQQAQQQQAQEQQRTLYQRAYGACMEGRGYVIK